MNRNDSDEKVAALVHETMRDLLVSFQLSSPITALLMDDAKDVDGSVSARLRVRRSQAEFRTEDVSLVRFSADGPGKVPAILVDPGVVTQVDRVSVRVAVPTHYRSTFVANPDKEEITTILSEMSRWGVRAHCLSGGKWSWEKAGRSKGMRAGSWWVGSETSSA